MKTATSCTCKQQNVDMLLTMVKGASHSCEQLLASSIPEETTNSPQTATTTSSDIRIQSETAHNCKFSTQRNNIMNPPATCNKVTTTNQRSMNFQTETTCVPAQQQSLNTYPTAVQTLRSACDYTPQRMLNASAFNCNNPGSDILQNQNMHYISCDQTNDLKTVLHNANNLTFSRSHVTNENVNPDPYFFSPPSQDFIYKFPKLVSLSAEYEMPSGMSGPATASTTSLVAHDLNLDHDMTVLHSVPFEHKRHSASKPTKVPETIIHGLARKRGSARQLLPQLTARHHHTPIVADVTGNPAASPANTPSRLPREGPVSECPRPRVSDFGSESGHVAGNHQSFAQSYASLTPWTSKLTAPGYVPLPVPAPDAMPIPLNHARKDYVISMPAPSSEISAKSWRTRPHQIYSQLKPSLVLGCYGDNLANSKTRNGHYSGGLHASRPGFKALPNKEHRFRRTAEALQKSGLWDVAMKTGNLIKRNRELQKDLEEFRSDAITFLKSVIKNPQNRDFIKNVLSNALTPNTASRNGSSIMTVVVSAAAAAASGRFDSSGSSSGSLSEDLSA